MPISYEITVILHILAALVWVGGILFIGGIALPAARKLPEERRRETVSLLARSFRPVGWTALLVLICTGLYLMWVWGARPTNVLDGSFFETPRAGILYYKLILVAAMLVVSGLHDWYVGPKATELAAEEPEEASPWRTAAGLLGGLTALLVVTIVVLAIVIARPWMTFWH